MASSLPPTEGIAQELPGQNNKGPDTGLITETPLIEQQGLGLIFSQGEGVSNTKMLGENGPKFSSKTLWKGDGKERVDVENHNPGQRPGQIHYQDNNGKKYSYDPDTNSFPNAPNSVNKLLSNPSFDAAIKKGLVKYLGSN